MRGGGGCREY